MATPASIRDHPIHPMLIALPIGLWVFSLAADIIYLITDRAAWLTTARHTMTGGVVTALIAAVPGFIDFRSISVPRIKKVALTHMVINLTVVALYTVNLAWRFRNDAGLGQGSLVLSLTALALLSVSGWLGGSLVYKHGVGVSSLDDAAHPKRVAAGR